ncbi:hypothetical protein OC845_002284 [Tilletia horrida]|nr:hypothetical protein OC845_002284 [Tilletia horrida]
MAQPKPATRRTAGQEAVRIYLIAYNYASFFGWSIILFSLFKHLAIGPQSPTIVHRFAEYALKNFRPLRLIALPVFAKHLPPKLIIFLVRAATAQQHLGGIVTFVQSFAVLEVVHAALGLVRSPVGTTAIQVGSRLFSVWGVAERYSSASTNPFYASMIFAWSLTECVRYPFYAQQLLGNDTPVLLWARYTLFYVLYPLGAISEAMLIQSTLPTSWPWNDKLGRWDLRASIYAGLFLVWWYGLFIMYTYMIKQRRKALGKGFFGSSPEARKAEHKIKEAPSKAAASASAVSSDIQTRAQAAVKRK